jgi:serine/threonine protein phosphatase PrpC
MATGMLCEFWDGYTFEIKLYRTRKMRKALKELFLRINQSVVDYSNSEGAQMGSTLTVLYLSGKRFIVAHAGDSRVYLLRRGKLMKLTEDQTLPGRKNVLTNCIGKPGQIGVCLKHGKVSENDVFLLCSDGFYNRLPNAPDNAVISILSAENTSMQEIIQSLLSSLKDNAPDNLSAVLIKCNFR